MNPLVEYKEKKRLTNEELLKELKDKLGRPISMAGLEMMMQRKEPPLPWLNALGISPKEPGGLKDGPSEKPKNSPPDVNPTTISLPFEPVSAKATIELIYTMAGKGAAMASRTEEVARAWEINAPSLADAWINWAAENRAVANGIAMLTVGGPGGQVILMNASLIITTLMLVQQKRNINIIPEGFNIYEGMTDEQIRAQTEQAVDDQL